MIDRKVSRRDLLLATAGIGTVFATLAASSRAFAMSQQTLPGNSELGIAYANRCTANTDGGQHSQIMSTLQDALAKMPGTPGQVLTRTAYCPICGCPIIASRTVE